MIFFKYIEILNATNNKESIVPIYLKYLELKSILSSENVITKETDLFWEDYVDMESFWLNLVSSKEKIPSYSN